jgi:hypothetical protein
VLFGPGYTVTEHASYADILLISIALAGWILAVPRLSILVVIAQLLNLLLVWATFQPQSFTLPSRAVVAPSLHWPMLVLGVLVGGALLWRFFSAASVTDTLFEQQSQ